MERRGTRKKNRQDTNKQGRQTDRQVEEAPKAKKEPCRDLEGLEGWEGGYIILENARSCSLLLLGFICFFPLLPLFFSSFLLPPSSFSFCAFSLSGPHALALFPFSCRPTARRREQHQPCRRLPACQPPFVNLG